MSRLLSMGLYRLRKDVLFRIALIGSVVCGILFTVMTPRNYDDMYLIPFHVLIAAFVSLFCGREYGDGTIRNKVICGHSKGTIYLSTLLINYGASLLMSLAFLLPHIVLRLTVYRLSFVLSAGDWVLCALTFVLLGLVDAALFTLIAMLIPNRALSAILNVGLVFVMVMGSYQIDHSLGYGETIMTETSFGYREATAEEVEQIEEGAFIDRSFDTLTLNDGSKIFFTADTEEVTEPNPFYVGEPVRTVLETLIGMIPHGQIVQYMPYLTQSIVHEDEHRPVVDAEIVAEVRILPFYSIGEILLFTALGYLLYRKKELK